MVWRVISSCALAGFMVAQWAAMPHGHAPGSQLPHDHSATSHIHRVAFGSALHRHHHDHDPEANQVHRHWAPESESGNGWQECGIRGIAEHDADALYLPSAATVTASSRADRSKLPTTPAIRHFVVGARLYDLQAACNVASPRPPDEYAPGCGLYLALRALRI